MADSEFVYVRNAETGAIGRMSAAEFQADAQNLVKQGLIPIPQEQVVSAIAQRRAEKLQAVQETERRAQAATLGGMAKTAGEGVASGAVDALTAVPRAASALGSYAAGTDDPFAEVTGRHLLETGAYAAGGGGTGGAAAAQEYAANARARAAENPVTATGSSIAGQVIGSGGLSALGQSAGGAAARGLGGKVAARIAGAGVAGAAEGAPLALVQAQDQAYLEQRKLTGEQAVASMGVGALLGFGAGAGTRSFGEAFGAVQNKTSQLVAGKASAAGEEGGAVQRILRTGDKDLERTVQGAIGEELQPHTTEYVRQGVRGENLSAARRAVHEEATEALASSTNDALATTKRLVDKVDDRGWKLSQVEAHAESFAPDALEQAQARAAALRQDIRETVGELGKDAPKTLKGLAEQLDRQEFIVRSANSPAKAYMGLDQMRRDLLATSDAFGTSAKRVANVDEKALADAMRSRIGQHYDDTWQFLMDQGTWGQQGLAQQEVNTARSALIQAEKNALPHLASEVGTAYEGAGLKSAKWEANEGKLFSTVQKLGTTEGAFAQRQVEKYLQATQDFAQAAQRYGLDAGDKAAAGAVQKNAQTLQKALADAQEKASSLNQAETFLAKSKEGHGLLGGSAIGHMIGGPVGTAAGLAIGAASNPAKFMVQRLALEQAAAKAERIAGKSLDTLFAGMRETSEKVAAAARKAPSVSTGPVQTALELFQGRHATPEMAYVQRVKELQVANANYGQQLRDGAERSFGTLAADDPHAVNAAIVAGSKGVQALLSALPVGTINPKSLTPNAARPTPTRLEIQQFADVWTAVMKPMDVIKQLPSGTVSIPQMRAIQQTYPVLYGWLRQETVQRLAKMDEDGVTVPIHAIDTLDTLLDLGDAAGPTYATAFAVKYSQQMGDAAAKARQPKPPKPSAKGSIGQRLAAGTSLNMMGAQ